VIVHGPVHIGERFGKANLHPLAHDVPGPPHLWWPCSLGGAADHSLSPVKGSKKIRYLHCLVQEDVSSLSS
jgi:hypothetical protein